MKLVRQKLIDAVQEETGIKLGADDLQVTTEENYLKIALWNVELMEISCEEEDLEDEDFIEDVFQELQGEYYDLREKIVELKLEHLNNIYLPNISENIIARLEDQRVDERLLDVLDFEFVSLGYLSGNYTKRGEEEWDYPAISLRITDFEDVECNIPMDPDKDPSSLDHSMVCHQIIKKIRGKV